MRVGFGGVEKERKKGKEKRKRKKSEESWKGEKRWGGEGGKGRLVGCVGDDCT